ncbi:MAG: S8 family serine peptidase [Janthinobacterium lividum]
MSGTSPTRPVLRLKVNPKLERVPGRGSTKILPDYDERRTRLLALVRELTGPSSERTRWFGGHALLHVTLDPRCQAPSWTPHHLFAEGTSSKLIGPWDGGYLVEIGSASGVRLSSAVEFPSSEAVKQDISTIVDLRPMHEARGTKDVDRAWALRRADADGHPEFVGALAPFSSAAARRALASTLLEIASASEARVVALPTAADTGSPIAVQDASARIAFQEDAAREVVTTRSSPALVSYVAGSPCRLLFTAATRAFLLEASSAGAIVRWDPVTPLAATAPGIADVNHLPLALNGQEPIVGVIDGGMTDDRYEGAVAWREPPFIDAEALDCDHGNGIARLIVDAHSWNELLTLPELYCRVGIVPVVPRSPYRGPWALDCFLFYLDGVLANHPDTKVWNLSANSPYPCASDRVSDLGYGLSLLARRHRVLFVISTGNRDPDVAEIIAPPADSDSAITVGGRMHDVGGGVSEACVVSRTGRGPDDMLKPELSWFSVQRIGPDEYGQASSWAAPLVSRLAAHTWARLRNPTPDLVKALLIVCADHDRHRLTTGFGSPVSPPLPWAPPSSSVLLTWSASMRDRRTYTWEGIRIPASLAAGGKFRGRVRLVAILDGERSPQGSNYYSTRLQTSVRYLDAHGAWANLVGSLATETDEQVARRQDDKWQPIRFNSKNCTGKTLGGPELQVQARLFWRDAFGRDIEDYEAEVTFVFSIQSTRDDGGLHDEFVEAMGAMVEVEVVEIEIGAPAT